MTSGGDKSSMADAAKAFGLVAEFLGSIALFTALGYGADLWRGTTPRYTLIGLVVGLLIGFYRFVREAMKLSGGRGSKR